MRCHGREVLEHRERVGRNESEGSGLGADLSVGSIGSNRAIKGRALIRHHGIYDELAKAIDERTVIAQEGVDAGSPTPSIHFDTTGREDYLEMRGAADGIIRKTAGDNLGVQEVLDGGITDRR